MDNPMELLNELMKNKDAVEGVKNLLNNSDVNQNTEQTPDISFLTNLISENKQSAQVLGKLKNIYDVYRNDDDPSIRLLNDLSPFLSGKKAENVSKIANLARISKVINKLGRG